MPLSRSVINIYEAVKSPYEKFPAKEYVADFRLLILRAGLDDGPDN